MIEHRDVIGRNRRILEIPCLVATQAQLEWLQKAVERAPQQAVTVDMEKQGVRFGNRTIKATVPDGPQNQLVGGRGIRPRRESCRT